VTEVSSNVDPIAPDDVAILGIPYDLNSTFLRGSAEAPLRIRETLHSGSANLCVESGMDLGREMRWRDAGDLTFPPDESHLKRIEVGVSRLLEKGARVISLGGDHSVTHPILQAYSRYYSGLTILHLDAHPDLYDQYEGNREANACPFARIMEKGLARRLVQVGIRTMNPHQQQQADRFGVEVLKIEAWRSVLSMDLAGPLYLSLDIDVLDPAFAPGVSHHEPGGLTTRDVLTIIQNLKDPVVGADIVEFNPRRDPTGATAMVAAKLTKEVSALLLKNSL